MGEAEQFIKTLKLLPHPEGGYYRETYRSPKQCTSEDRRRSCSTAIYFLLERNNFSAFHRIRSDELWHFYAGDTLEVIEISPEGNLRITFLGKSSDKGEVFQHCVPAGHWFASWVKKGGEYALVGCTVAPGFDFEDFEMAERNALIKTFPQHAALIEVLTRVDR